MDDRSMIEKWLRETITDLKSIDNVNTKIRLKSIGLRKVLSPSEEGINTEISNLHVKTSNVEAEVILCINLLISGNKISLEQIEPIVDKHFGDKYILGSTEDSFLHKDQEIFSLSEMIKLFDI